MPKAIYSMGFIIFWAALFAFMPQLLNDADTGWHLMAGHHISQHGLPQHNIFSFGTADYQWFNLSWLWDLIFAQIENIGGLYYTALATMLIVIATLLLLTKICVERSNLISGVIVTLVASYAFMLVVLVRPHQVSLLFILIFYYIIQQFVSEKRSAKILILLPILMALWVNLHGGFLAVITIFGAFGLQLLFDYKYKKLLQLFICGLTCLLSLMLNPYGAEIFDGAMRTLGGPLQQFINEWQPASSGTMFVYHVLFIVVIFSTLRHHKTADLLLSTFWLVISLTAARYIPIFALLSAPTIANGLKILLSRLENKNAEYVSDLSKPIVFKISTGLAVVVFVISLCLPLKLSFSEKNYPIAEINYLLAHSKGKNIFNFYDYGGVMTYLSKGELKTFIDGRAETAFPPQTVSDFMDFSMMQKPGWEQIPEKYEAEIILWPKEFKQHEKLVANGRWFKAFEGDKAVVLIRSYE